MSDQLKLNIDALIFAVDNVLVDITLSQSEVVRGTVQLYLEQALGLPAATEPLLTPAEVTLLQTAGDFTNYQDLAATFILYFIELLPPVPTPTFPIRIHVPAMLAYLQMAGGFVPHAWLTVDRLREQKDVSWLAETVAAAGGGFASAKIALPKVNRHLLLASGPVTKTNLVGRIFQELYLGTDLFSRIYAEPALIVQSQGYLEQESLLIDLDLLLQISHEVQLGLISNRSRLELAHLLKAKEIEGCFQSSICLDDVQEAEADYLPHPWPLLEAARRLQPLPARSAYIGATPSDIQAAKAANQTVPFTAIGCLTGAPDKEKLRRTFETLGANIILGHPNHLKELILD